MTTRTWFHGAIMVVTVMVVLCTSVYASPSSCNSCESMPCSSSSNECVYFTREQQSLGFVCCPSSISSLCSNSSYFYENQDYQTPVYRIAEIFGIGSFMGHGKAFTTETSPCTPLTFSPPLPWLPSTTDAHELQLDITGDADSNAEYDILWMSGEGDGLVMINATVVSITGEGSLDTHHARCDSGDKISSIVIRQRSGEHVHVRISIEYFDVPWWVVMVTLMYYIIMVSMALVFICLFIMGLMTLCVDSSLRVVYSVFYPFAMTCHYLLQTPSYTMVRVRRGNRNENDKCRECIYRDKEYPDFLLDDTDKILEIGSVPPRFRHFALVSWITVYPILIFINLYCVLFGYLVTYELRLLLWMFNKLVVRAPRMAIDKNELYRPRNCLGLSVNTWGKLLFPLVHLGMVVVPVVFVLYYLIVLIPVRYLGLGGGGYKHTMAGSVSPSPSHKIDSETAPVTSSSSSTELNPYESV